MNQVMPHSLWLGHAGHGQDFRQIFDAGIRAVVYLAAEEPIPDSFPRELIATRFPLVDGAGNRPEVVILAISTVASLLRLHTPTLVCCGNGISRAPAIAAAALAMIHPEPPEACLKRVLEHHSGDVSPGFWNEVTGLLPGAR